MRFIRNPLPSLTLGGNDFHSGARLRKSRDVQKTALAMTIIVFASLAEASRAAETLGEALAVEPPMFTVGSVDVTLGGSAAGALFSSSAHSGPALRGSYDVSGASAAVRGTVRAQRIMDNGMVIGAGGDVLVYHDKQSGDRYGDDTIEKIYAFVQTGFGRVELGQQDGAAYTLGLVGPLTNPDVTLENHDISLFRDAATGDDFAAFYQSTTAVQSTSNFAKINYISPRLFGVQVGASFTPAVVRTPLPFTGNPEDTANRQHNIFELAVNYTSYISNLAVGLSAGYAHGFAERKAPGAADLDDFAVGAQFAYTISDLRLSAGGAYRMTNAYLLDIANTGKGRRTNALHLSAMAERGAFLFGVEFSDADIKGPVDFGVKGYQVSAGYKLNDNLQFTAGWQWYDYKRDVGTFFNGLGTIDMNAGFLSLGYQL